MISGHQKLVFILFSSVLYLLFALKVLVLWIEMSQKIIARLIFPQFLKCMHQTRLLFYKIAFPLLPWKLWMGFESPSLHQTSLSLCWAIILKPSSFWFKQYLTEHNLIYKCILKFKDTDNKAGESHFFFPKALLNF